MSTDQPYLADDGSDVTPYPCGKAIDGDPHDMHPWTALTVDGLVPRVCPGEGVRSRTWLAVMVEKFGPPSWGPINGRPTHAMRRTSESWMWFLPDSQGVPRNNGIRIDLLWTGKWCVEVWRHSATTGPQEVSVIQRDEPTHAEILSVLRLGGVLPT